MLQLLPADALIRTGPVDHADWNYRPLLGAIQRLRFRMAVSLLPAGKVGRLLEIGYGSGVLMPELARHCDELHGVDIHPRAEDVQSRLAEHGVTAHLRTGSAEVLPYESRSFDCLVAVSSLEFVPDIAGAVRELHRVLRTGGCLVLVTPGRSALVDAGLKLLTGESAATDYADRRQHLLPALERSFVREGRRNFPPLLGRLANLYTALRMRPSQRPSSQ